MLIEEEDLTRATFARLVLYRFFISYRNCAAPLRLTVPIISHVILRPFALVVRYNISNISMQKMVSRWAGIRGVGKSFAIIGSARVMGSETETERTAGNTYNCGWHQQPNQPRESPNTGRWC